MFHIYEHLSVRFVFVCMSLVTPCGCIKRRKMFQTLQIIAVFFHLFLCEKEDPAISND